MLVFKLKTKRHQDPIPELDGKMAMLSFHSPMIQKNDTVDMWPALLMWTLVEEKPLPPGQYDFYKTELGETVEIYVDAGIDWFNRQIRERSYEERYLDKVIRVDDLIFAEFIATRSSRALLCFGRPPVKKGWRPMRGEGGMYYKEMDLSWNVTRDVMKNAFGLTSDQAARFMKEYRLQKKQPKRRRNH